MTDDVSRSSKVLKCHAVSQSPLHSCTSLNFVFFATVEKKKEHKRREMKEQREGETRDRTMTLGVCDVELGENRKKCIHLKNKFGGSFLAHHERDVFSLDVNISLPVPVACSLLSFSFFCTLLTLHLPVSCLMNFTSLKLMARENRIHVRQTDLGKKE